MLDNQKALDELNMRCELCQRAKEYKTIKCEDCSTHYMIEALNAAIRKEGNENVQRYND